MFVPRPPLQNRSTSDTVPQAFGVRPLLLVWDAANPALDVSGLRPRGMTVLMRLPGPHGPLFLRRHLDDVRLDVFLEHLLHAAHERAVRIGR